MRDYCALETEGLIIQFPAENQVEKAGVAAVGGGTKFFKFWKPGWFAWHKVFDYQAYYEST
jgi:hypothetical protein